MRRVLMVCALGVTFLCAMPTSAYAGPTERTSADVTGSPHARPDPAWVDAAKKATDARKRNFARKVGHEVSTQTVSTCTVYAITPRRTGASGNQTIRGDGKWGGCTQPPDSCSLQAYLQIYIEGGWVDYAAGPEVTRCPPTSSYSIAGTRCVVSSRSYRFRTEVQAIISVDGDTEGGFFYSSTTSHNCY